jgi:hypothetical protein
MTRQPRVGPAWENLARLLVNRRVQLAPRYRNRRVFCEDKQLDYRVVSDIEGARRANFSAPMLTAIEVAYDLADGAIQQALTDPDITELPIRAQPPAADNHPRPTAKVPAHVSLDDLEPWEQGIWLIPDLSDTEKESTILLVRLRRGTIDDEGLLRLYYALGKIVERRLGRDNPGRRAM